MLLQMACFDCQMLEILLWWWGVGGGRISAGFYRVHATALESRNIAPSLACPYPFSFRNDLITFEIV